MVLQCACGAPTVVAIDRMTSEHRNEASPRAFIIPFAVFMLLLELIGRLRIENALLPWWRQFPEHWGYPLQVLVCAGLLWGFRKHYPRISFRGAGLGVAMGGVGILIWLLPVLVFEGLNLGEREVPSWLSSLGFQSRREGFNPTVFGTEISGGMFFLIVALRFVRMVLIVSLVEEIFWRGFLMRWITAGSDQWAQLPFNRCNQRSLWLTALAFAAAHAGPDFLVSLIYGALAGWVAIRTGNLWAVVIMHMTANALLGIFIMQTGWWGLW